MNLTPPADVRRAALDGMVALAEFDVAGDGIDQANSLSRKLCLGEPLTADDMLHLRVACARPCDSLVMSAAVEALGGDTTRRWLATIDRAQLTQGPMLRLSQRLGSLEDRLAERILGQLEAVTKAAISRVGQRVANRVRRGAGNTGSDAVVWLDTQPAPIVRAALSELDENVVRAAVSDLDTLLPPILSAGARELRRLLRAEVAVDIGLDVLLPQVDADQALDLAKIATAALVLGRLSRTDDPALGVPPNIARDVLRVAGGADSTPAGGVLRSEMGRPLRGGVESAGDGFATSDTVLGAIQASDTDRVVQTRRVWRHSGSSDAIEVHERNDGKDDVDCDFSAGPPGALRNCGCRWETIVEVV